MPRLVVDCSATAVVGTHRSGAPIIAIVPAAEVVELTPEEAAEVVAREAAEIAAEQAAAAASTQAAQLRQQILALAQSAVGVPLSDLTAAQRNALIVGLLHLAGGVTSDMKVRPLNKWLT